MAAKSFNPMAKLAVGVASVTAVAALAGTMGAEAQQQVAFAQTGNPPQYRQYQHDDDEDDDDDHDDEKRAFATAPSPQVGSQQSGRVSTLPRTRTRRS